ncbi:hypothetical protein HK100_005524 [Physocladia obscura]|uniref:Uncharacterized protein n=1 Tax=Physocladia obscura TaxID=109957 RepID=A0AAD5SRI5_9FUNG|nr:hypothetical protein HK100_005524 [Physocladia obscura]
MIGSSLIPGTAATIVTPKAASKAMVIQMHTHAPVESEVQARTELTLMTGKYIRVLEEKKAQAEQLRAAALELRNATQREEDLRSRITELEARVFELSATGSVNLASTATLSESISRSKPLFKSPSESNPIPEQSQFADLIPVFTSTPFIANLPVPPMANRRTLLSREISASAPASPTESVFHAPATISTPNSTSSRSRIVDAPDVNLHVSKVGIAAKRIIHCKYCRSIIKSNSKTTWAVHIAACSSAPKLVRSLFSSHSRHSFSSANNGEISKKINVVNTSDSNNGSSIDCHFRKTQCGTRILISCVYCNCTIPSENRNKWRQHLEQICHYTPVSVKTIFSGKRRGSYDFRQNTNKVYTGDEKEKNFKKEAKDEDEEEKELEEEEEETIESGKVQIQDHFQRSFSIDGRVAPQIFTCTRCLCQIFSNEKADWDTHMAFCQKTHSPAAGLTNITETFSYQQPTAPHDRPQGSKNGRTIGKRNETSQRSSDENDGDSEGTRISRKSRRRKPISDNCEGIDITTATFDTRRLEKPNEIATAGAMTAITVSCKAVPTNPASRPSLLPTLSTASELPHDYAPTGSDAEYTAKRTLRPYPTFAPSFLPDGTLNAHNFRSWKDVLVYQKPKFAIATSTTAFVSAFKKKYSLPDVRLPSDCLGHSGSAVAVPERLHLALLRVFDSESESEDEIEEMEKKINGADSNCKISVKNITEECVVQSLVNTYVESNFSK